MHIPKRKRPLIRNWLSTATGAILASVILAAGPAAADSAKPMQSAKRAAGMDRTIETINIMPAKELIGRNVLDSELKTIGKLKYLIIRPDTAEVIYALVDDDRISAAPDEFFAVPWDMLNANVWVGVLEPGLSLKAKREKVRNTMKWSVSQISKLSDPVEMTKVYEYYGIAMPEDARTRETADDLVIGQTVVSKLSEPIAVAENQLLGIKVETGLGGNLGHIDEVVIDLDNGRVAYLLLARGGFLGSGEEWLAVPLQALKWNGYDVSVDLEAEAFRKLKGLDRMAGIPTWVRKQDLKELYGVYDANTYWTS